MAFLSELGDASHWLSEEGEGSARVPFAALARRLRERAVAAVGLLPADDDVAVPPAAVRLGRALADVSSVPVAILDADGSWAPVAAGAGARAPTTGSWIRRDLAVLAATRTRGPLDAVRAALAAAPARWGHVVVDLTGLDRLGDHVAAFELLDGVILVARSGRTRLPQIRRALADVPPRRALGVLLTGA